MVVRPYRTDELPSIMARSVETALAQLVARDLPQATPQAVASQVRTMFQTALSTPGGTILVVDWPSGQRQEGPAAYALLSPVPGSLTGAPELIVLDIFTDPALRGRRVGRSLLAHAEAYARSLGCRGLVAQVALHNRSSLTMFLGAGFSQERVVVGKPC